jgi:Raf kinase inhibitor-like YbhB/YbcL family protein
MIARRQIGAGAVLSVLTVLALAACGAAPEPPAAPAPRGGTTVVDFRLTSAGFTEGTAIPAKYTCDGENKAPPLRWDGAPQAQSFVLILEDPDAPGGTFTHWVLYDIPGAQRELPEALSNVGALGTPGLNDFSRVGYGGPCPPRGGGAHRYVFTLSALDVATLNLPPESERHKVEAAMRGHVLSKATLIGQYERQR